VPVPTHLRRKGGIKTPEKGIKNKVKLHNSLTNSELITTLIIRVYVSKVSPY